MSDFDVVFISNNPNEKRSDSIFWEEYLRDETKNPVSEKKSLSEVLFKSVKEKAK